MIYPWLNDLNSRLNQLASSPPQALCLVGPSGLGHDILAQHFVQTILSSNDLPNHPDYLCLTPEEGKSLGIDKIREISEFCLISPTRAVRKIVIIQPIDAMTGPAQQAFLKTLEEPIIPTTFILICHQANLLLPTLRSRCQVITLQAVPYAQAQAWLRSQNQSLSPEAYALTDGAPLLVLEPGFKDRVQAYELILELVNHKKLSPDKLKLLNKAKPHDILSAFYHGLMRAHQFDLLDQCIALRQRYADNANLNWDMQLNTFILEVQAHVV